MRVSSTTRISSCKGLIGKEVAHTLIPIDTDLTAAEEVREIMLENLKMLRK